MGVRLKRAKNKTIVICSNYAWTIYNFRMSLIRRLKAEGYRVIVLTEFDGYEKDIGLEVDVIEPLFISRKGINPFVDFFTIVDMVRHLLKFKPNTLLTFSIKPVIYGSIAAKILKIPSIVMITGLGTVFITDSWVTTVVKRLYRFALSEVSTIFFQNIDDRDIFVSHKLVDKNVCRSTPGSGVDIDKFSYSTPPNTSKITFLLIARMLWDKGIGEFVEAAKIIKLKYPHVRFQLLGPLGVQNRTSIKKTEVEAWQNEGIIEYLGQTDDVASIIEKACCVILPSYREGTSRVLLEAAAMGRPLIATDVPGCREVIQDGVTGLLCAPRDYVDLSQKIETMLGLTYRARKSMGIKGREKIENEFRQEIVCDLYIKAIHSCKSS
jgi:glycosyltransferase involved in cell wall biosynthesis